MLLLRALLLLPLRRPLLLLLPPRRSKADKIQLSASCKKPAFGPAFLFPHCERNHRGKVSCLLHIRAVNTSFVKH
jgi:hypothetical protein